MADHLSPLAWFKPVRSPWGRFGRRVATGANGSADVRGWLLSSWQLRPCCCSRCTTPTFS